jgi:hypothetical protein
MSLIVAYFLATCDYELTDEAGRVTTKNTGSKHEFLRSCKARNKGLLKVLEKANGSIGVRSLVRTFLLPYSFG